MNNKKQKGTNNNASQTTPMAQLHDCIQGTGAPQNSVKDSVKILYVISPRERATERRHVHKERERRKCHRETEVITTSMTAKPACKVHFTGAAHSAPPNTTTGPQSSDEINVK